MNKIFKSKSNKLNDSSYDGFVMGCRIPKDFFIAKGVGESDITIHAGSYHLALREAGIEMCNIMTYSSILPSIAHEIKRPKNLVHGSVMETIMAVSDVQKGERATAAIIFGLLYDKKTNTKYGGMVCEYHGNLPEKTVKDQLHKSLNELYENGYSKDYMLKNIKLISNSFIPTKKYGTALVALCFTSYQVPIINGNIK